MQLINNMAAILRDDRTFNEKLALALIIPLVFWIWGPVLFTGHAYMVIVAGIALVFLMLPSVPMKLFGLFYAIWSAWLYSSSFVQAIPSEMIDQATMSNLLLVCAAVYFLIVYRGKMPAEYYANWICGFSVVLCVIAILMYYLKNLPNGAFLGNQNFLAAWLAISLSCFYRGKWVYFVPLIVFTLFLTRTTTAFVAAAASTTYFFYPYVKEFPRALKVWAYMVLSAIVFFYAFFYHPFIDSPRFGYWMDVLQIATSGWHLSNSWPFITVTDNWQILFVGVGPGVLWKVGDMIHSEYFYGLFYFGIVGVGLYLWIMASVPRSNRMFYASFVAIAVDMIGNHVFHTAPTAILSIITVALLFRPKEVLT